MKKFCDRLLVYIMCALCFLVGIAFFLIPKHSFSASENRTLSSVPDFSASSFISGEYMSDIGKWYADTFPMRDVFVGAKAYMELAQFKMQNNGVMPVGERLIALPEENDTETLSRNLAAVSDFSKTAGADITVCAIPRAADVCAYLIPPFYPSAKDRELFREYENITDSLNIKRCDTTDILTDKDYYISDHHYTTDGAYKVYVRLGEILGYEPYGEEDFQKNEVSDSFCGTSMRTSGLYLSPMDKIYLYRYDGDSDYTVICDGESGALYNFSALEKTDKYAVFLGGNHARADIYGAEGRPRLLIIRDSFADSIVPFLARHYDITLIDLRYYKDSIHKLYSEGGYEKALVLCSISALEQNSGFAYLYK